MTLAAIFLFFFRNQIGPLFVNDAHVGAEVAGVAPICAAYQMPDGVYGVASGVLRYMYHKKSTRSCASFLFAWLRICFLESSGLPLPV